MYCCGLLLRLAVTTAYNRSHSFGTIFVPKGGTFFYYVGTIIPEDGIFFIMLEQLF